MVTLEASQPCLTEPDWLVVIGGEYSPDELVECMRVGDTQQRCAFYALFIATGGYPE